MLLEDKVKASSASSLGLHVQLCALARLMMNASTLSPTAGVRVQDIVFIPIAHTRKLKLRPRVTCPGLSTRSGRVDSGAEI